MASDILTLLPLQVDYKAGVLQDARHGDSQHTHVTMKENTSLLTASPGKGCGDACVGTPPACTVECYAIIFAMNHPIAMSS